jgi:amino acid transporter
VHLAEESHRPEITVPRAMMTSFVVGTIGAFVTAIVLLYGISDVVAVLTTPTGSPFVEIVSKVHQVRSEQILTSFVDAASNRVERSCCHTGSLYSFNGHHLHNSGID